MFDTVAETISESQADSVMSGSDFDKMAERLIIALDVSDSETAMNIIERIGENGRFYKVGLQLLTVGGIEIAKKLEEKRKNIFLDYKLFDIGITVQRAMESILKYSHPDFITVHGDSLAIKSASEVVKGTRTKILAVSVPTNWSREYIADLGYKFNLKNLIARRAEQAVNAGAHGLICSAQEVRDIRKIVGDNVTFVTPGIRMPSDSLDDQKRVASPENAIREGADYLVVGRPITTAADPTFATSRIIDSMVKGISRTS